MMRLSPRVFLFLGLVLPAVSSGCGLVLGLDKFTEGPEGGTGGKGGGAGCKAGESLPCDTPLKGPCATGTKSCLPDQTGFGACKLDVQPAAEDDCTHNIDANCDGMITCACAPGAMTACMTGLKAECAAGMATCKADSSGYGDCVPGVTPTAVDDCVNLKDTTCNGVIDCACQAGKTAMCTTMLKAACAAGTQTCKPDGSGYDTCLPDVTPTAADDCVNLADTTCNGTIDCTCQAGKTTACMTGLKAACAAGVATCKPDGSGYDTCVPDVAPTVADDCVNLVDTNCNGVVDCVCQGGTKMPCASGLPGACAAGTQTCTMDGKGYAACVPNVAPGSVPEDCKIIGDENCDGISCSDNVWSFLAGDVSDQSPTATAVDSAGNIFVTGYFDGALKLLNKVAGTSITLSTAGGYDYFLAKFTPAGDVIWAKSFGTALSSASSLALAVDAGGNVAFAGSLQGSANFGNGAVTAVGMSDILVVKFDSLGAYKWAKSYGSPTNVNYATSIAFDTAGDVLIGGASIHALTIVAPAFVDTGAYDGFVAKLKGVDGSGLWATQIKEQAAKPNGDQVISTLVLDGSNNIFVGGQFAGSIYLGAVVGSKTAVGNQDGFLAKLDSGGAISWAKVFGTSGYTNVNSMAVDTSANLVVTGLVQGNANFGGGNLVIPSGDDSGFLAKYSTAGVFAKARVFVNGQANPGSAGISVTTDQSDNIYLTGYASDTVDLGGGAGVLTSGGFIGKFDATFNSLWGKSFNVNAKALRFDTSTNRLVFAGSVTGNVNFGTGQLTGASGATGDLALAKFQP